MEIKKLMQPYRLKNMDLRNRIVMAPMLSRLCDPNGVVSQKLIDYYAARAEGGVGLIISEYCYIDDQESKAHPGQLGVYDDQLVAGLGDLAEAIQERGAKAILSNLPCRAGHLGEIHGPPADRSLGHTQLHRGDGPGDDLRRGRGRRPNLLPKGRAGPRLRALTAWNFTGPTAT